MEKIKTILRSKQAKTFYWQTANGAAALLIIYFGDVNWVYAPLAIALLNTITKYININYL